nr:MAG TPA: chitin synthase regulator [Bacteriophage sp.]
MILGSKAQVIWVLFALLCFFLLTFAFCLLTLA